MRALTWVAAIVLSVTALSHTAVAQAPASSQRDPDRAPLRAWLQETSGNQISFGLNDSAYIAVFELYSTAQRSCSTHIGHWATSHRACARPRSHTSHWVAKRQRRRLPACRRSWSRHAFLSSRRENL